MSLLATMMMSSLPPPRPLPRTSPEHLDDGVAAAVVRVDALHAVDPTGSVGAMADQVQVAALRQKIIKKRYNHESGEIKKE